MKKQVSLYPETKTQEVTPQRKKELLALCEEFKKLTGGVACCSDALDFLGFRNCVMSSRIKPYFPEKGRLCGLAYTLRGVTMTGVPPEVKEVRDVVDLEYLENIEPGYVLTYGTNTKAAMLGDVLSTYAVTHKAVGAVLDGPLRDIERIAPLDFLPFGDSITSTNGEGRVLWVEFNCLLQVGGVWVEPFDILFGDVDGVIVIPKHLAEKVLEMAKDICDKEDAIKADFFKHPEMKMLEIFNLHDRRP